MVGRRHREEGFEPPRQAPQGGRPGLRGPRAGVAYGLAWTEAGGTLLPVESLVFEAVGEGLILTGNLGDVMKESARASLGLPFGPEGGRFRTWARRISGRRRSTCTSPRGQFRKTALPRA